jgi:hypothetical protein
MAPAIDMEAPLPNPPLAPLPQYQAFEWSDRGEHYLRIVIVTRPNKRR